MRTYQKIGEWKISKRQKIALRKNSRKYLFIKNI